MIINDCNGRWKVFVSNLSRWIDDHILIQCARCQRWAFKKDTRRAQHRLAGWVRICLSCTDELYPDRDNWEDPIGL